MDFSGGDAPTQPVPNQVPQAASPQLRRTTEPCGSFQTAPGLPQLGSDLPRASRSFDSPVSPARIMPGQDHGKKRDATGPSVPLSSSPIPYPRVRNLAGVREANQPRRPGGAGGGEAGAQGHRMQRSTWLSGVSAVLTVPVQLLFHQQTPLVLHSLWCR